MESAHSSSDSEHWSQSLKFGIARAVFSLAWVCLTIGMFVRDLQRGDQGGMVMWIVLSVVWLVASVQGIRQVRRSARRLTSRS